MSRKFDYWMPRVLSILLISGVGWTLTIGCMKGCEEREIRVKQQQDCKSSCFPLASAACVSTTGYGLHALCAKEEGLQAKKVEVKTR